MSTATAHVWITADDAGVNEAIDRAIVQLAEVGVITGASLFTTFGLPSSFLQELDGLSISLGIHFNLSSGTPLSDAGAVPTLVNSQGRFHEPRELYEHSIPSAIKEWTTRYVSGFDRREVVRELRLQLMTFESWVGGKPSFSTFHHDLDVVPLIREAGEEVLPDQLARQARVDSGVQAQTLYDFLEPSDRLGDALIRTQSLVDGAITMSRVTRRPCEIVCHPSVSAHGLGDFTVYASQRAQEFRAWSDARVLRPMFAAGRRNEEGSGSSHEM